MDISARFIPKNRIKRIWSIGSKVVASRTASHQRTPRNVCAHRLVLAPRARLHDETARSVLAEILERVPQPAVREFKS